MLLDDYVTQVQTQLSAAAALGDERTKEVAAALAGATGSAVRLAILDAIAAAVDEINASLLDNPDVLTIGLHLQGDQVQFQANRISPEPAETPTEEGEATARISLRLSEQLKSDVERAAETDSVSVNTWLVRAARAHLASGVGSGMHGIRATHRITGWISG